MEKLNKKRLIVTFILYCLLVMWIILLRMNIAQYCAKYRGVFLIPFSDNNFYSSEFTHYACVIGNILLFIPLGIYFCLFLKEKKVYQRIFLGFIFVMLASLFLEITQYICVIGVTSTTDLFHNGLGGIIGIIIYELLKSFVSNETINAINKCTVIILIPVIMFAFIKTIVNFNLYI